MKQKKAVKWPVVLLAVLCVFSCLTSVISLYGFKESFGYEMDYEISPLWLTGATMKSCQDMEEQFDLYDGERLYELQVTYENIGDYEGDYQDGLSFTCEEGVYCYQVYPDLKDYDMKYAHNYDSVIPAGMTGTFRYYLAIPEGVSQLTVQETDDKLNRIQKSFTIAVPVKEEVTTAVFGEAKRTS